jgi:hypothetical protein
MSHDPHDLSDVTANDRVRWDVERAILSHVRAVHGDQAVAAKPISPRWTTSTHLQPVDYRHGVEAAKLTAAHARREMLRFAAKARGDAVAWADLADPLGIRSDPEAWCKSPAEAAFELVAGHDERSWARPAVLWDCGSCGAQITDRGPYNGHPDDDETGHTSDCRRHADELAAWTTNHGDD